jgi:hypothetical protein
MRRCVVIVLALLAVAAPASARPVVHTSEQGFPQTNGRDAAVWSDTTGSLHVSRDDGTSRTFPVPTPGCALGGVNRTAAGFLCGASPDVPRALDLVDLQSGEVTHPASEAQIEAHTGPTAGFGGYDLEALGDHVARIGFGDFHSEATDWFSLDADGGLLDLSHPPVGSVIDLDAPGGITSVCAPAPTRATTNTLFRAPWILTRHGARVQLRRCGSRVTRSIGVSALRPVLTGRFAAWNANGRHVVIRMLSSGRTYRIHTPDVVGMVATDHRLWLRFSYRAGLDPQAVTVR